MSEALPVEMLARVHELAAELLAWVRQHRDAPLLEQEQAVLTALRAAAPGLLETVLQLSTSSLDARQARLREGCPGCEARAVVQSWRPRRVLTMCGPIAFERPWYVCPACGRGWSPTDLGLGLSPWARLSLGLQAWVARVGAATTFREATDLLRRLAGLAVGPETVRRHTEQQGEMLDAAQRQAGADVSATQEAAEPLDPAPGTLLVEADGVMLRYLDGWHEAKVGLVAGHQDGRTTSASYVAARAGPTEFGPRLLAEAARRGALEVVAWEGTLVQPGLATLREVAVLGDGAPWIWNLAAEHFGRRTEIVDFYHASEHLWTVARALHGPESPEARAWAETRVAELWEQGAGQVLAALALAVPPSDEASEVLRREQGYFTTNADRMAYSNFRAQGLPIGSGAVESTAKHLVQQRMKRAGMRWSDPGAQAMLALRAHLASERPLAA